MSLERLASQRRQVITIVSNGGQLSVNAEGNLTPGEVILALELYKDQIKRNIVAGANSLVPGMLRGDLKRVPSN